MLFYSMELKALGLMFRKMTFFTVAEEMLQIANDSRTQILNS